MKKIYILYSIIFLITLFSYSYFDRNINNKINGYNTLIMSCDYNCPDIQHKKIDLVLEKNDYLLLYSMVLIINMAIFIAFFNRYKRKSMTN
jgi:hypothetical protein